jgi:putative glutamine amidotransferase
MRARPLIGVSGPDQGGFIAWAFTWYAVKLAGGRACRLRPRKGPPRKPLDGLIIGGGADIDPSRYGEERMEEFLHQTRDEKTLGRKAFAVIFYPFLFFVRKLFSVKEGHGVDSRRDVYEFELMETAWRQQKPVLGICRGAQLLNVFLGGTLFQDIGDFYREVPNRNTILPRKRVTIEPDSRLAAILGRSRVRVNALHHQAVRMLGQSLRPVAREPNGIIQAIEHEEHRFLIGLQWHPEYLPHLSVQKRIFQALVQASRR